MRLVCDNFPPDSAAFVVRWDDVLLREPGTLRVPVLSPAGLGLLTSLLLAASLLGSSVYLVRHKGRI